MVEIPRQPSREEREFWDDRFHDGARPRRSSSGPGRALPQRGRRLAQVSDGPLTRLVDRVRDWRTDARFGVIVLVVIAVVAGVVWYRIGVGGASTGGVPSAPSTVATTGAVAAMGNSETPTTGPRASGKIAVHVAGAVTHPGVVELKAGARVIDAVEAVGGALTDGDLDRLNLAAKVVDGQRIYVAKVGQADPGVVSDPSAGGDGIGDGTSTPGGKVNLNTATQAQLEALPGIGPTYAQSIIAERQRRGAFKSVNDLRSVRGIGDKRFAELAPLVTL